MFQKDKIKSIVAIVVFGGIAISYYFFGKEITKYVALAGFSIWFGSMYFLNKK
ncbi:MAG: hypothetical protein JKY48_04930 [Flavobacteriales bacterium]|nr:hypothetical protein [Flavobacteriales bacterium]